LQFGSTGKGLFAGYIARENTYDTVISINTPNAGHTFIDERGNKFINKILPSASASPFVERILIGPGAAFTLDQLKAEVTYLRQCEYHGRIHIHENAWVVGPAETNAEGHYEIGSTRKGAGAAAIAKISRNHGWQDNRAWTYRDKLTQEYGCYVIKHRDWRTLLRASGRILLEGAQGWSLSINGPFWPYCTSRDCTPARFLSDAMVPLQALNKIYGVMRVHPIRVGGDSGPWYPGQTETTWERLDQVPEKTTVTQKIRRVADFSMEQIEEAVFHCEPDEVFLNFVNYDEKEAAKIHDWFDAKFAERSQISWWGKGPNLEDITEVLGR